MASPDTFLCFLTVTGGPGPREPAPEDNASAQALAVIHNAGFELLRHPPYSPFVFVLHGKWLAGRPRTTILLQRNQSFGKRCTECISVIAGDHFEK